MSPAPLNEPSPPSPGPRPPNRLGNDDPAAGDPVLALEHVSIALGRRSPVTVLEDISLCLHAGECLGLVGESGAGKSMLAGAVLGLLASGVRQTGGAIRLQGQRIDTLTPAALGRLRGRRIGAVFQHPMASLDPLYTVGAQLIETLRTHHAIAETEARQRALALLAEVGVPAPERRLKAYPHQLSGGLCQRVVLALALAGEPAVVLADEPTTALDVSVQAQIVALLRRLCRERGTAILLISHDLGVVAEAADRVAVLYAGRLVECGPVERVLGAPAHPYSRALLAALPRIEPLPGPLPLPDSEGGQGEAAGTLPSLEQIPGTMPSPGARPGGCAFHPRCAEILPRCATHQPAWTVQSPGHGAACWQLTGEKGDG